MDLVTNVLKVLYGLVIHLVFIASATWYLG